MYRLVVLACTMALIAACSGNQEAPKKEEEAPLSKEEFIARKKSEERNTKPAAKPKAKSGSFKTIATDNSKVEKDAAAAAAEQANAAKEKEEPKEPAKDGEKDDGDEDL